MKTLLLMRHAKSNWEHEGLADHERPLNNRGLRDAPVVGRRLLEHGLVPDVIVASTAVRAQTTARLVAEGAGYTAPILAEARMYGGGDEAYLEATRRLSGDPDTVLLVGHNPDMESLVEGATGTWESMPTAALVRVDLVLDNWADIRAALPGKCAFIWRPKEIE